MANTVKRLTRASVGSESSSGVRPVRPKSKSSKNQSSCSVCEEVIRDTVPGQDAVHCDGECASWLHRRCAGLTKESFKSVCESVTPFYCVHCRSGRYECELIALREQITHLADKLTAVSDEVVALRGHLAVVQSSTVCPSGVDAAASGVAAGGYAAAAASFTLTRAANRQQTPDHLSAASERANRKFNIILLGIEEDPPGTSRIQRQENDAERIVSVCSQLVERISEEAIKDHFRLGKFRPGMARPRPLMVKFIRSGDANAVLSRRGSLTQSISVRPDLSPEARKSESVLMKERWSLIEKGVERSRIKIRNSTLMLDRAVYGKLDSSQTFHLVGDAFPANTAVLTEVAPASQLPINGSGVGDTTSLSSPVHLASVTALSTHDTCTVPPSPGVEVRLDPAIECVDSVPGPCLDQGDMARSDSFPSRSPSRSGQAGT